jgi:hypothetical protein
MSLLPTERIAPTTLISAVTDVERSQGRRVLHRDLPAGARLGGSAAAQG